MIMLYFSGTGNSAYVAKKFAKEMEIASFSIEEKKKFDVLMEEHDVIAVCYPIYGSCVPRIMREFAERYRSAFQGKKLVILCTQMVVSGDGARAFSRLFPSSEVIYAEHINMANNICNLPLLSVRDGERNRKRRAADRKIQRICREIRAGKVRRRGFGWLGAMIGRTQNQSFPALEERARSSFRADQDCIGCGLCAVRCPMQNLSLEHGKIVQHDNCTLCYRCVNLCPEKAATIYLKGKPKRQYRGPEQKIVR